MLNEKQVKYAAGQKRDFWARPDRSNNLTSERRSEVARMGRGADAFSAKESREWEMVRARMDFIVEREKGRGDGSRGTEFVKLSPYLRLHILPLAGCALVEVE
jgi:hypothetical protein